MNVNKALKLTRIWTLFLLLLFVKAIAINVSSTPCCTVHTPNSILDNPLELSKCPVLFVGDKKRYSTCSGVCWFQGDSYLFALNLSTNSVQVYAFQEEQLVPIRFFNNGDGLKVNRPDCFFISSDNSLIVITNIRTGVNIYRTDLLNFLNPIPIVMMNNTLSHGARFSADNHYLAYTLMGEINSPGKIHVCEIIDNEGELKYSYTCSMINPFHPMKAKSIDFSLNGKFVVIGFSGQIQEDFSLVSSFLVSYPFNANSGKIIPCPISVVKLYSVETTSFTPDGRYIFATDQALDRITIHSFNESNGTISPEFQCLENPEAMISFPHGVAVSPSGKYVAISHYGGDKITIHTIQE